MTRPTEIPPVAVSEKTRRTGKTLDLRFWVEPTVWTERMLAALQKGVKGGKWFSLIDKVHPARTLRAAFSQVAENEGAAGVDHVTIPMFESHRDEELKRLSDATADRDLPPAVDPPALYPQTGDAGDSGRWEYRRSETEWFKRQCAW